MNNEIIEIDLELSDNESYSIYNEQINRAKLSNVLAYLASDHLYRQVRVEIMYKDGFMGGKMPWFYSLYRVRCFCIFGFMALLSLLLLVITYSPDKKNYQFCIIPIIGFFHCIYSYLELFTTSFYENYSHLERLTFTLDILKYFTLVICLIWELEQLIMLLFLPVIQKAVFNFFLTYSYIGSYSNTENILCDIMMILLALKVNYAAVRWTWIIMLIIGIMATYSMVFLAF